MHNLGQSTGWQPFPTTILSLSLLLCNLTLFLPETAVVQAAPDVCRQQVFICGSLTEAGTVLATFPISAKVFFLSAPHTEKKLYHSELVKPDCADESNRENPRHYAGCTFSVESSLCAKSLSCLSVSANSVVSSSTHIQTLVFACFLLVVGLRIESAVPVRLRICALFLVRSTKNKSE